MMDFARRLVPLRAADTTRAVAVLPSRFGSESPLQSSPRPVPPRESESLVVPATCAMEATHDAVPRRDAEWAGATEAGEQRVPASTPRTTHEASRPARLRRADLPSRDSETPAPAPVAAPIIAAPERLHLPPAASLQLTEFGPIAIATRPAAAIRAPLSEFALAERSAQTEEPRPIVHVTIDRIEVRAVAAPPRPAPPPRSRSAAPSVSLGDYLRQRPGKPGGAA